MYNKLPIDSHEKLYYRKIISHITITSYQKIAMKSYPPSLSSVDGTPRGPYGKCCHCTGHQCDREGQICGSDGTTYSSYRALVITACRTSNDDLIMSYPGPCQGDHLQTSLQYNPELHIRLIHKLTVVYNSYNYITIYNLVQLSLKYNFDIPLKFLSL